MPVDKSDLIWIEDATAQYGRSRQWLDNAVRNGELHAYDVPGDRRVYLSKSELAHYFQPRERKATSGDDEAQRSEQRRTS